MTNLIFWAMALIFTIALILALALLMKRLIGQNTAIAPGFFGQSGSRRLKLIESLPLDHKSRLVLVSRDNKEHLLLLNQTGDLLIESGIAASTTQQLTKEEPS